MSACRGHAKHLQAFPWMLHKMPLSLAYGPVSMLRNLQRSEIITSMKSAVCAHHSQPLTTLSRRSALAQQLSPAPSCNFRALLQDLHGNSEGTYLLQFISHNQES